MLLQTSAGETFEELVKALLAGNVRVAGNFISKGIQNGQELGIASAISVAAAAV